MRAAWIATVNNIDWPSTAGLDADEQKKELCAMLDKLRALNFNAIFIQIRPTADAFYVSKLEPWSAHLTGRQGSAPIPFYDPLEFIVEQAHARCIEVHAWLNPYRVSMNASPSELHPKHIFFRQRELFVEYGGKFYFNPAYDQTREFLNRVVADVVERYDIDAVHFDDYFYPYRVAGKDFPDNAEFEMFPRGFAKNQKADWRRNNVNLIIKELSETIKKIKPWVEFGISPFGVWRNQNVDPKGSPTRAGMTNYDDLYADILKWLQEGTIDYVVPQLYWEIGRKNLDYIDLLQWWSENSFGRNLYIGMFASGLGVNKGAAWHNGNELARQLRLNREQERVSGSAFYSAAPMLKNPLGLVDSLKLTFFNTPALVPVNSKTVGTPSVKPKKLRLANRENGIFLTWETSPSEGAQQPSFYVVYALPKNGNLGEARYFFTAEKSFEITDVAGLSGEFEFAVSAVNRLKQESEPVKLDGRSFKF